MDKAKKLEALFAAAQAYFDRGNTIQYDQLSLDRLLQITPRRRYSLPPEAATTQQRLYLDCATFICAVYYNAFGYLMEAHVTWNMRDLVKDCVFRHDFDGTETENDIERIKNHVRSLLQPGDVLVFSRENNGHIMLYKDEHTYLHCTSIGNPGSYDYEKRFDNISEHGGLYVGDPKWWLERSEDSRLARSYLFNGKIRKFAVLRPLNHVGDPTPDTLARLGDARRLVCSVTVSHPGGRTAAAGEPVEYTLSVTNRRETAAALSISFSAPEGCRFMRCSEIPAEIPAGDTLRIQYSVSPEKTDRLWLEAPEFTVNGLHVYAPRVLLGEYLTQTQTQTLLETVLKGLESGLTSETAFSRAYRMLGIEFPEDYELLLNRLFYRYDSTRGAVLSRRIQQPQKDMAVYSYFGGTGVITPEAAHDPFIRTIQLNMNDLQTGDIILCGDDYTNRKTYACMRANDGFIGCFDFDASPKAITGAEAAAYLDSVQGRYVFVLMRPSMARRPLS